MTPGLLALVQWLSPAFPTGAFACSHGAETAIADGRLATPAQVQAWLETLIAHGSGWQDAVLLAQGLAPDADLDALADTARALAASAERWAETRDQGAAFAATLAHITGRPQPALPLPLAVAHAARPLGVPVPDVLALYLHAFASNLVTIAVRAVPLGQSQGQAILSALAPLIRARALLAATARLDDLATSAFAADLAAMAHETLQPRLYRT
ncbi:MAG: urease accessory protein UreF [Gemmobacter sp.]|uniref:urease accessory protein UreF n=1 Tax=Gemmobacter sp. TaxID=1898957 RepID=UPI003919E202